jgi:hypothetical protein
MLPIFLLKLVTQEFAFHPELLAAAKDFLQTSATLKFDGANQVIFVSVHVRRTGGKFINIKRAHFLYKH